MQDNLDYLHDCVLLEIRFDMTDPENRKMILLVEAPDNLGYDPWSGRPLWITASGILFLQCVALGHCSGRDSLDRWNPGISHATELELARLEAMGVAVPAEKFRVIFHSGSWFELVCESISVDVISQV